MGLVKRARMKVARAVARRGGKRVRTLKSKAWWERVSSGNIRAQYTHTFRNVPIPEGVVIHPESAALMRAHEKRAAEHNAKAKEVAKSHAKLAKKIRGKQ